MASTALFPRIRRQPRETVIAVNVGGCIIPLGIAIYQLSYIAEHNPELLMKTGIAVGVTTIVCYFLARPVVGVGIAMPGFVPPLVSAAAALLLAPSEAPPVVFVAGVAGPLVGADLLHLADVRGSELAWPASGELALSTALCSRELSQPIMTRKFSSHALCGVSLIPVGESDLPCAKFSGESAGRALSVHPQKEAAP